MTSRVMHWICPEHIHFPRQFNSIIHFLVCLPIHASHFSWQEFAEYWMQEDSLDEEARTKESKSVHEQYFFIQLLTSWHAYQSMHHISHGKSLQNIGSKGIH